MWIVLGIYLGLIVIAWLWTLAGPILALLNFCVGRFFIASVLMTISLFCASKVVDDFTVPLDTFKELLILGLILEAVKWTCVYLWRSSRRPKPIIISIEDEEEEEELVIQPMKDVTPRLRRLSRSS